MANQEITRLLGELVRTNATARKPSFQQVNGLSNILLSRAGVQKPWNSGAQSAKDNRGPGVVNRVLDIMSRPLYAIDNALKGGIERAKENGPLEALRMASPITNPEMLKDIWGGLSGKEKTTGRDILETTNVSDHLPGIANAALGFGLDVGLDPLTYVGGLGLAGKVGKGAKASSDALHAVEQGTAKTAQSLTDEISRRAAKQASDLDAVDITPGMPAPKLTDPPRTFAAGPGPIGLAEQAERFKAGFSKPIDISNDFSHLDPDRIILDRVTNEPIQYLDDADNIVDIHSVAKPPVAKTPKNGPLALEGPKPSPKQSAVDYIMQLNKELEGKASPIAKNQIRQKIEGASNRLSPEELIKTVSKEPTAFPNITVGTRWIDTAKEAAQSFLKNNRLKDINHVGQTNLYNKILHSASKVRKDRRAFHVFQMLRVAEDELLGAGRHLTDADGLSMRLSDLANMMGGPRALNPKLVDEFRKVRPSAFKEDLKAFTTPSVVSKILDPVIQTGADVAKLTEGMPPSRTVMVGSEISKELRKLAEAAGASSKEARTAKKFVDELFNVSNDKLYSTVHQEARNLLRQTTTGIVNPTTLHKITEEAYKTLGANPRVLGRQLNQSQVTEGIMTKFATWWGAKDLKPFSREYIDTARNVAAAFSETMKPLVASTTASQRKIAWAVAQGRHTAGNPQEAALAQQFQYMVERLLGTHGIDNADSVLARSGTIQKEINDELPKHLKFTSEKGTDKLGRKFDYSNGNWMHSWKEWEGGEPAEHLYQLTRALQMVTRKNSMWDDAAARWGMPVRGAEYQHQVKNIERLKGQYFPEAIANQLDNLSNQLGRDVFKTPHKAIEMFDKVQRMWKTGVTIYSPAHHIRNLNGDVYLAALDGVVSPKPYAIATKILHAYPSRYKSLESVFNIMDPNLRERALRARPGNYVVSTKAGEKLTAEQVMQAAESQGLFVRAMHAEDLIGDGAPANGTFGAGFKPFNGKVYDAATAASELRDHWVRLAHFVDILSKSKQPLRVAVETAGKRVRKFHPDGMDLTGFEQNVLRRVIPFYSWMRKATPLVIEGAIMRPHITLAFPKAMANMQLISGIESQGPGDPFPVDQMFPDWIKEKGIGPILNPGSGLGRDETWRGKAPGYTILNPTNPFTDQIQQLGDPTKTILSSLSPVARIPIELLTGQTSLGIPLENVEGGTPGYLAQQIPAVGTGARLTGLTRDNEPYNPEQLINWLTGAGVTGTGPYKAQSKMEIQDLMAQMAKKNRGDYR